MGRRATVFVFAALIVFGAGLRFWKLSSVGLWYDELCATTMAGTRWREPTGGTARFRHGTPG